MIINSNLSTTTNKDLSIITECEYQVFTEEELQCSAVDHILNCPHEVLSPDEAKNLRKKLGVTLNTLSCILQSDAICRYYNWPVGTIIKEFVSIDIPILSYHKIEYSIVK